MPQRAFKYRFYPTPEQEELLVKTFGCVRYVWNWALVERQRMYASEGKSMTYVQMSAMLPVLKSDGEHDWLKEVSSVALQQSLRNLQEAYSNFFSKRSRYPQFKFKRNHESARFVGEAFSFKNNQLYLAKLSDPLDICWSRPLPSNTKPSSVTVSRDPSNRWFVSILVDDQTIETLSQSTNSVGIDVGLSSLATLSNGEKITNPRHERKDREKLTKAQRDLSRKQKGSKNRQKARLRVARIHARIADRRSDNLHKLTTRLIRENQVIAIEDLSVRTMLTSRKMSRAISDVSWYELRRQLEYKADWYGRTVVAVDRYYPSTKTCSHCGSLRDSLPLNIRKWTCDACGTEHDRDINAAKNILSAGLAAVTPVERT